MKLFWKINLQLIVLLLLSQSLLAQDIPAPMSPPRLVNDFANIFSESEKQALESRLLTYNDTTSTQIYVVTVSDLGGYEVSDYAFKLGEKWEIGQKGKDNGAVILVKPKVGNSRGRAYISVGYGLEGSIPDGYAGRIIRNQMIPHFETDDYFSGVNSAIDSMAKRLAGEFDPEMQEEEGMPLSAIILFVIFFIIFIITISKKGDNDQNIGGDGSSSSRRGPVFFPPIIGGGRRGSFGGGGGFGGGGFGGGGGGRFGGGGAGGSW